MYDLSNRRENIVKVSYPLKQGLKPFWSIPLLKTCPVKVSYPLKQGLKLFYDNMLGLDIYEVKVSYPLKQGLKHFF